MTTVAHETKKSPVTGNQRVNGKKWQKYQKWQKVRKIAKFPFVSKNVIVATLKKETTLYSV